MGVVLNSRIASCLELFHETPTSKNVYKPKLSPSATAPTASSWCPRGLASLPCIACEAKAVYQIKSHPGSDKATVDTLSAFPQISEDSKTFEAPGYHHTGHCLKGSECCKCFWWETSDIQSSVGKVWFILLKILYFRDDILQEKPQLHFSFLLVKIGSWSTRWKQRNLWSNFCSLWRLEHVKYGLQQNSDKGSPEQLQIVLRLKLEQDGLASLQH